MKPPFRITVCGLDELDDHRTAGVSHVLSILDPGWPVPEAFGRFGEHRKLELRFHDVIDALPGSVAPGPVDVQQLLAFGAALDREPVTESHLLVHCHAGVSRSSASMALVIAQAMPDRPGDVVFDEVLRIRPQIWPNLRIVEMGDRLLGRNGDLIAAAHRIYNLGGACGARGGLSYPLIKTLQVQHSASTPVTPGSGAAQKLQSF
jgi:predicted protein tyrosine phosphatase